MVATPAEVRAGKLGPGRVFGAVAGHPIVRAVAKAVLTIWATTTLTFFLIRLMPGSPVELKIDELMQAANGAMTYGEARATVSSLFSIDLNAPLHEQYLSFMGNVLHGNLGSSFLSAGTSVTSIIVAVLPWTLFAVGTGLMLSFGVGVALGLLAAYRRNTAFDRVVTTAGSIVSSVPNYLLALMIVVILGSQLRLLPIASLRGAFSPGMRPGFTLDFIGDVLYHASLPIAVFFLTTIGNWILSMRSATLATLDEDFVVAARARGLPDGRITTAYVGRNAILPLVTQLAIATGFILGGAVVIEQIFVYEGVGLRLLAAINQRDYPLVQGILLLATTAVVVANLVADLLYSRLDPRIGRAGGASG